MLFRKNWVAVKRLLRSMNGIGRFWAAIRWYRLWRTFPVFSWIRAAEFFKSGDFREAARLYQRGLKSNSDHPASDSARLDMAYCLYRLDEPAEALEILNFSIGRGTSLKDTYLLAARIHLIFGRALSAMGVLGRYLEKASEDVQALTCLMYTELLANVTTEQLEVTKRRLVALKYKLLLEDERNVHIDTALAHFEIRRGDVSRGERLLARVLATGSAPFEAVLLRGERLLEMGRIIQAREQLSRAMRAVPKDPRPVMLLARSYLESGELSNMGWALQLAEAACRLSHWQNAESLHLLACVYEASDEKGKAQLFLERMKNLPSMVELNISATPDRADEQKVSNT